jgi:hypothetical protein
LLETNPTCPDKDAVLQLMAQAQQRWRNSIFPGGIPLRAVRSEGK